jgi:hypothetical protein
VESADAGGTLRCADSGRVGARGGSPDYLDRIRAHPAASFTEPIRHTDALRSVSRAFVRCTTGEWAGQLGGDPVAVAAAHALEAGWTYREINVGHDPQVFDAEGIARLMMELAN